MSDFKPNNNLAQRVNPLRCVAAVWGGWHSHQCANRGTQEHNGKRYCGIHYPPAIKAKRDAKNAAWRAKNNARAAAVNAAEAERKLRDAALAAIRLIAAGHNDPGALAREVLKGEQ